MSIFNVLSMMGGLALFLYGMNAMGDGLAKLSGGRLEKILEKLTAGPIRAVLLGAFVTAAIQSSSATTVMVVGFVNSGIMKLSQAVGIIMGANIGTTITSWLLSLSSIEGSSLVIQLLKPTSFSPVLALIGVIFLLFTKSEKKKDAGMIFIGFAILMYGMEAMSTAVKPLADVPEFTNVMIMFKNPILGMIVGAVLTAIIQSSSASVGILQALCQTGAIHYSMALPIIMGQNIGTCVTAMISSIGASKNAKRAALVHLYFNLIGTILFMVIFYLINLFFPFAFLEEVAGASGIATIHTVFNVTATVILLPFGRLLEKMACMTIRDQAEQKTEEKHIAILDSRFLDQPSFAMEQCMHAVNDMAEMTQKALMLSVEQLEEFDEARLQEICRLEEEIDHYEDELGNYLVKLSGRDLTVSDSRTLSMLLHDIGDFERISDHAINISEAAEEMKNKKISFSEHANRDMKVFTSAVCRILAISVNALKDDSLVEAKKVEPLEEVIDQLNLEMKERHIRRLREGKCTIELGFILSDLTTDFERVSDHCSNIALNLIAKKGQMIENHEYREKMFSDENEAFKDEFQKFSRIYHLE